jgi:hypothetical protein
MGGISNYATLWCKNVKRREYLKRKVVDNAKMNNKEISYGLDSTGSG